MNPSSSSGVSPSPLRSTATNSTRGPPSEIDVPLDGGQVSVLREALLGDLEPPHHPDVGVVAQEADDAPEYPVLAGRGAAGPPPGGAREARDDHPVRIIDRHAVFQ